ncbi:hypothetical protein LBMAG53_35000 [Planctomycetota bacterium]|nr:hypothetical protein LBMAG53_35000 [Planctomycetota bacterium]
MDIAPGGTRVATWSERHRAFGPIKFLQRFQVAAQQWMYFKVGRQNRLAPSSKEFQRRIQGLAINLSRHGSVRLSCEWTEQDSEKEDAGENGEKVPHV